MTKNTVKGQSLWRWLWFSLVAQALASVATPKPVEKEHEHIWKTYCSCGVTTAPYKEETMGKPTEKELAEKLYEALWRRKIENSSWEELNPGTQDDWRKVASVAEEHFKGKP